MTPNSSLWRWGLITLSLIILLLVPVKVNAQENTPSFEGITEEHKFSDQAEGQIVIDSWSEIISVPETTVNEVTPDSPIMPVILILIIIGGGLILVRPKFLPKQTTASSTFPKFLLVLTPIFIGAFFLSLSQLIGESEVEAIETPVATLEMKVEIIGKETNTEPIEQIENAILETINGCEISEKFPDSIHQWCSLISQYATQYGFDANLIAALILQESGGNPEITSHSGAVGLMQIMPRDGMAATFMCVNGPCFSSRPTSAELQDPEYNIEYGTRMLSGLQNRHDGDIREALKAYGPMDRGYEYADKVLTIYDNYK
jgi:hypothetical protein